MKPKIIPFSPTHSRNSGLDLTNYKDVPVPFEIQETSVVRIPTGEMGGNHSHPRTEAFFVAAGEGMELVYLDQNNQPQVEKMSNPEKLLLFVVPPNLPHAVRNTGNNTGILIEFADAPQENVKPAQVISAV
jgi:quercetin dioxygenase-like cupin family protein